MCDTVIIQNGLRQGGAVSPLLLNFALECFLIVSCLAYSTLKMKAVRSSETSLDFYSTTLRYISDDSTLHRLSVFGSKSELLLQLEIGRNQRG
jgi:hypothetical protein